MAQTQAEATMQEGGWGKSKSFRDVMRDSDGAADSELITLTESDVNTGTFTGHVVTAGAGRGVSETELISEWVHHHLWLQNKTDWVLILDEIFQKYYSGS